MNVLIIYDSQLGSVKQMARLIARGVETINGVEAKVRRVPSIKDDSDNGTDDAIASIEDLSRCDGLILGSPTRFGNMSSAMKDYIDQTSGLWMKGSLEGKPAAVFTSSSSMHGGQESTLLSMMIPLLHHGMLISGIPYSEKALHRTSTGGTPYGASHVAGSSNTLPISEEEKALCIALGKRVARLAEKIKT